MRSLKLVKLRWKLLLLGLIKIPMIHFVRPKLISIDESHCVIKIKLRRRCKNHLNSMYFGALAVGADVAAGIHAYYFSELLNRKISLVFKSMTVEFLKRAETDVIFKSSKGLDIAQMLDKSIKEAQRINKIIEVRAENTAGEIVAVFQLELSLKAI